MQYFALNNKRVAPDIYTFIIFLFRDFFSFKSVGQHKDYFGGISKYLKVNAILLFLNLHCLGIKGFKRSTLVLTNTLYYNNKVLKRRPKRSKVIKKRRKKALKKLSPSTLDQKTIIIAPNCFLSIRLGIFCCNH